ncbi:hypothetical protein [Streptomyces sp. NPDC002078]
MTSQQWPAPARSPAPRPLSEAAFRELYRWLREQALDGGDRRRGALERLTPERVVAAAEVRCGRIVSLAAGAPVVRSVVAVDDCSESRGSFR